MKKIPLTKGQFALVDDDDFDWLSKKKWHAAKQPNTYYAVRTEVKNGKKKCIWMHREINKTKPGMKTDHINGDGLNNTKENLRSASHQENMVNCARWKSKNKYRGVSWHKLNRRWVAQMTVNYKNVYIGSFKDQEDARKAYEEFREKARLGQIRRSE